MISNPRNRNKAVKENITATIEEINNTLRFLAETGCRGFDCTKEGLENIEAWGNKKVFSPETLEAVRLDLGDCRRCRLSKGRKNIVFGAGNPQARLVFVGEGPGYEEDQKGEPFVGSAGRLLTKIIEAIKHTRKEVISVIS